jgi:hypothetical protein
MNESIFNGCIYILLWQLKTKKFYYLIIVTQKKAPNKRIFSIIFTTKYKAPIQPLSMGIIETINDRYKEALGII